MAGVLDKIFADKAEELKSTERDRPLSEIKNKLSSQRPVKDIRKALAGEGSRIIAEIKRKTPFLGEIRKDFDAIEIADCYAHNGAAAISVLTEKNYFGGKLEFLEDIEVDIPLLRKDFIFNEYQVYESRAYGADLFLLIATQLEKNLISDLMALGKGLGMTTLVESHSEWEMEIAIEAGATLLGINNRDLKTGKTDLDITRRLLKMGKQVPDATLVCESGISSRQQIEEMEESGIHAFLIGGSLMTSDNISEKLQEFLGHDQTKAAG
ncbi:MAG: indole-3-glycerol phosphate synthase TrpC [Nitrospinales bacterium]